MSNPLLEMQGLPPFSAIKPEHVEPAVDVVLEESRQRTEALLAANNRYTWDNLVAPLEAVDDRISRVWSPVSHMNSVVNSEALRAAYNACLPKLSDYATEMGQHEGLFSAFRSIAEGPEYRQLDTAQRKVIDNALRDFRLSGIDLPAEQKARYKEIQQELSRLTSKFEENLLDATDAWTKLVRDESLLSGLPDSARAMARQAAKQKDQDGWLLTLEFPSYYAVMTYADDRSLREELYQAYVTRASDHGPHAGHWDNTQIMEDILRLRYELAQLLGFPSYAQRSLATKMAENPEQVQGFLSDLANRSLGMARQELEELNQFATQQHGIIELQAWDISYYSEKLRQQTYAVSQEDLKPYFPAPRVIPGMFEVVKRLYGIEIREVTGVDTWHPDVRFYEIYDGGGELRGQFYLDLYARSQKRGGAWMDECVGRRRLDGSNIQIPVAYLTCNFTPPVDGNPALLTHNEVTTLFHEFGHGLHHMLTKVDYSPVSGISGVPWDAVELPSQFMENWCWERDALDLIAAHYETGEPLPEDLYARMRRARNFQAGMQMVRQLEFAMFDFRLHLEYDPTKGARVQEILDEVRAEVAVIKPPVYNRFQHGFSHIFAGGYAAGYYSYKWAEVLSSDAFAKFEQNGIFDRKTGLEFLECVLEQGGAREPMDLFVEFRGRKPEIDALLRHSGIAA
ncbi:MAG: oligopeptidase A [Gammaproteobacteria bacterium SG8_47]|nr:MAG: oligopeptidase A [Gammaproteobacteria bacterium SG8_47]